MPQSRAVAEAGGFDPLTVFGKGRRTPTGAAIAVCARRRDLYFASIIR